MHKYILLCLTLPYILVFNVEKFDLVAKGSLLSLDTDRVVVKRVVLSGSPYKINKRSVVVRYMFFNRGNSFERVKGSREGFQ